MTDDHVRCLLDEPHEPHMVDLGFVDYDCPGIPVTACRAAYERPAGPEPVGRIGRCQLDAGHTGNHVETDTGMTWAPLPRMALAQPRTVVICGQLPLTPLVVAPRPTDRPCVLAGGHTGGHETDDGMRWFDESDTDVLTGEQDIRARALHEAAALIAEVGMDGDLDAACDLILEVAGRFAAYIASGVRPTEPEHRLIEPDESPSTVEAP